MTSSVVVVAVVVEAVVVVDETFEVVVLADVDPEGDAVGVELVGESVVVLEMTGVVSVESVLLVGATPVLVVVELVVDGVVVGPAVGATGVVLKPGVTVEAEPVGSEVTLLDVVVVAPGVPKVSEASLPPQADVTSKHGIQTFKRHERCITTSRAAEGLAESGLLDGTQFSESQAKTLPPIGFGRAPRCGLRDRARGHVHCLGPVLIGEQRTGGFVGHATHPFLAGTHNVLGDSLLAASGLGFARRRNATSASGHTS